ncbi:STAS domain-containing protein [Streptomyces sp. B93]|uniref:STAS domain-containing protein n=1 Tax=Streptomyces sp. B93 TaxID=2824875 RepID=UPI001B370051|nr:STAS domain-containing protein [Streptomyces sp. B93]MBQ1089287.1 STAS domain-containing protein [Streptomyces sp. B93]
MTLQLPDGFRLKTVPTEAGDLCVRVIGDLDWDTADELTKVARGHLESGTPSRALRLDFTDLATCDSTGLAALLMIHRCAVATGRRLYLDHMPDRLVRLLELTGTLAHLTGAEEGAGRGTEER